MKNMYTQPELEVIKFPVTDVICISTYVTDEDELPMVTVPQ